MKILRIILIMATLFSCINCNAKSGGKVTDKTFQAFLDKFKIINPPFIYKKVKHTMGDLTTVEAMKFLQKKESDLYYMEMEFGLETEEISYTKAANYPGFDFKYQLNDSVYIVCTREAVLGNSIDTIMSCMYSFNLNGEIIDKGIIINGWYSESNYIGTQFSSVFLNKNIFRVYYYNVDDTKKDEGFQTSSYYVEYMINESGAFTFTDKSDIMYLKKNPDFYSEYDPNNKDDPMNEYNF
jgi:hypothetical protein